ncbi:MAG TPA: hypothetical protein VFE72_04885 [Lysobacter sp.]|nr:hypothetical protein [Lysobacter sp.]
MDIDGGTLALAFALTSVPAFLVARSLARSAQRRDPDLQQSRLALLLARLMRIVGAAMLAAAAAMLWAGNDSSRVVLVVLGVALVVNGLALAMFLAVMRGRRR